MAAQMPSKYSYGTAGNDLRDLEDLVNPGTRDFYPQGYDPSELRQANPEPPTGVDDGRYQANPQDLIASLMGSTSNAPTMYKDLQPGSQSQDLDRRMEANDLAKRGGMGVATDSDVMDFIDETYTPGMKRDTPPPVFEFEEGPQGPTNPQEFIRQQLAGDVVPMPYGARRSAEERLNQTLRTQTPGTVGRSGMQSIRNFGGPENPYLDLLDVLQYPSGRPLR